jgi:hypothetical protein
MELIDFIIEAKVKGYADPNAKSTKLEDNSTELIFTKENYVYRDRYFGGEPFSGQEVVFQNNKEKWIMNYYGLVYDKEINIELIYGFLRKCLSKVPKDAPYRGPKQFKENDFEYYNTIEGTFEEFKGHEKILYKGKEIYRLNYHGGKL